MIYHFRKEGGGGRYKFGAGEVTQYALSLRSFDESYDGVNTLMVHKFSDGP